MAALPILPEAADAPATLLSWFLFDDVMQTWVDIRLKEPLARRDTTTNGTTTTTTISNGSSLAASLGTAAPAAAPAVSAAAAAAAAAAGGDLTLVTWNVDAFSSLPQTRLAAILDAVRDQQPDILFLQEVSRLAMEHLLQDPWIRSHWYVSDAGAAQWGSDTSGFSTVTLVSRRFGWAASAGVGSAGSVGSASSAGSGSPILGALWRVDFPSLFGRYAICCEILMAGRRRDESVESVESAESAESGEGAPEVVRLVNVHLDSLQIRPSKRPRQLQIVANMLHRRGTAASSSGVRAHGLVAGDFNPVLPDEDGPLVAANDLVDAWEYLHPGGESESGMTWGIDGKQAYPPARLDKVAVVGLEPLAMTVMHPGHVQTALWDEKKKSAAGSSVPLPWSDHSGLWCRFRTTNQYD